MYVSSYNMSKVLKIKNHVLQKCKFYPVLQKCQQVQIQNDYFNYLTFISL